MKTDHLHHDTNTEEINPGAKTAINTTEAKLFWELRQLMPGDNLPNSRTEAAKLALLFCSLSDTTLEALSELGRITIINLAAELEKRCGPIDQLAAEGLLGDSHSDTTK